MLILSMICVSFSFFAPLVKSASNEMYVDVSYKGYSDGTAEKPYKTIEQALDNAEDGDTIYIFSGLYQEDFKINKKVVMVGGIDEEETIIDTRFDRRYMVEITADEVTIEGITFSDEDGSMSSPIGALIAIKSDNNRIVGNKFNNTGSYGVYIDPSSSDNLVSNNVMNYTGRGINIDSSSANDLANNEIRNSTEYGIYMTSSGGNNRLYSNMIYDCPKGIFIESCANVNFTYNQIFRSRYYAIHVSECTDGFIINNLMEDCQGDGMYLTSDDFYIRNNTILNNSRGITLLGSHNIIQNNSFKNLSASGIYIQEGNNNILYLNKFRENGVSASDQGNNQWYYDSMGNYWSDYNNIDLDEDGIGDVFYSKNGVVDKYPLGYFLKPPDRASEPSPEDGEDGVGLDITLEVTVTDPDTEEDLTVYFYKVTIEDDNTAKSTLIESLSQNPVKHVQNDTKVQCRFTLGFNRTFVWYVVVDDGLLQNQSDPFYFSTRSTPPNNNKPVVDVGGPYSGEANRPIQFNGSGSYDPDGTIDFYRWNFGDGSSEIIEKKPIHTFSNEGEYTVTLTIIDNNGTSETETTIVNIQPYVNSPPNAKISVKTEAYAKEQVTFTSESSDPNGDALTYNWSIDGEYYNEKTVKHIFSSVGTYIITLAVSDGVYEDISTTQIKIKDKTEQTPGFEILIMIFAIIAILYFKRKNLR